MQAEESIEQQQQSSASIWRTIGQAIRGTHQDLTQISISKAVFLLAIPMVLEMLLESLFGVVDIFWVTRLGSNAVVTVGLTESMLALVFSIALGLSFSTTAMVARRVGEKDLEGAATAAMQAIILGIGVAMAVGIPALPYAPTVELDGRRCGDDRHGPPLHGDRVWRNGGNNSIVLE